MGGSSGRCGSVYGGVSYRGSGLAMGVMMMTKKELREVAMQLSELKAIDLDWSKHVDDVVREALSAKKSAPVQKNGKTVD